MTIKQQGGIFGRNPTFNNVDVEGTFTVDNIEIDANTISTTDTNGALVLQPNGSGPVTIQGTQPRVRLIDTDATGTPEAEISASGGDLITTADRDNEKSDTLIRFLIDGGEKWKINSTGNLVVSNSGNGIDFSATSGTGTSELFDDYEEGTWTATLGMTSGSVGYGGQLGKYVKVGNQVTVNAWIYISSVSSPSGALNVSLPFAIASTNTRPGSYIFNYNLVSVTGQVAGWINPGTSTLLLNINNNGSGSNLDGTNLGVGSELYISLTYVV